MTYYDTIFCIHLCRLFANLNEVQEHKHESLNNKGEKPYQDNGMVEKRTNDTGKEQKLRRNNEGNLLKIAQINQNGVA